MSKENNIGDYLTALANSFRLAMGSDAKINAQTMLEYPPQLANGYENYRNLISRTFQKDQDLYIPEGTTKIAKSTFSVDGSGDRTFYTYFHNIYIPEGVTQIGDEAFSYSFYNELHLPSTLTRIGEAFRGYRSSEYNYKHKVYYNGDLSQWLSIFFYGEYSCPVYYTKTAQLYLKNERLIDVVIPKEVVGKLKSSALNYFEFDSFSFEEGSQITEIGPWSISNNIKKLQLPKSLKIFTNSLQNSKLEEIRFEGSFKEYCEIEFYSSSFMQFANKENFKFYVNNDEEFVINNVIVVPEGVTLLNKYLFEDWTKCVSTLVFPSTLTTIKNYAISSGVNTIKGTLIFKSNVPPSMPSSSYGINKKALKQIVVPKGRLDTYKTATNFSTYADIMVEATTNVINVGSTLMNNPNILYSVDGGEKQQFSSANFTLENIGALTIYNNSTDTINLGTTSGGTDIGTSGANTAITYTFTQDTTLYITKA